MVARCVCSRAASALRCLPAHAGVAATTAASTAADAIEANIAIGPVGRSHALSRSTKGK